MARQRNPSSLVLVLQLLWNFSFVLCRTPRWSCRNLHQDPGWPSPSDWQRLNSTVSGKLIATVPLAAPCHEPAFDERSCANIKEEWAAPFIHVESPTSFWAPRLQQGTCSPFEPPASACPLGNLPVYAINATSASDVAAGILFARRHNIRLTVKNTGHDYLGKSSGKGSLSIWTRNLNSIEPLLNYSSPAYTGAAIKLGAGVLSSAASLAAHRLGYRIVTGTCASIGIAGGYSMGGGFSALTSMHGLAADNVLEWDVVTADGTRTTASPTRNRDLYWALSGGGGGTFAVAVAMTTRLHRDDTPTGGAALSFNASSAPSADAYWAAGAPFLRSLPPAVDAGAVVGLVLSNTSTVMVISAPGQSADQVRAQLQPTVDFLDRMGIPYALDVTSHATYREHFLSYFNFPGEAGLISSRLIPRDAAALSETASASPAALTRLGRRVVAEPGFRATVIGVRTPLLRSHTSRAQPSPPSSPSVYGDAQHHGNSTDTPPASADSVNSVHPAWRAAVALVLVETAVVDAKENEPQPAAAVDRQAAFMKDVVDPALVALAPDSAPYLNEANIDMPDLVRATFGPNLARLRRIKAKWDADDVFYAPGGVGSDEFVLDAEGRLCRARKS